MVHDVEKTAAEMGKKIVKSYADLPISFEKRPQGLNAPLFRRQPPPFLKKEDEEKYEKKWIALMRGVTAPSGTSRGKSTDVAARARRVLWNFWLDSRSLWSKAGMPSQKENETGEAGAPKGKAKENGTDGNIYDYPKVAPANANLEIVAEGDEDTVMKDVNDEVEGGAAVPEENGSGSPREN